VDLMGHIVCGEKHNMTQKYNDIMTVVIKLIAVWICLSQYGI